MFDMTDTEYGDGVVCTFGFPLPADQMQSVLQLQKNIAEQAKIQYHFSESIPPLIRLYESVFPIDAVEKVKTQAQKVASEMRPFRIEWREIEETVHSMILWGERNALLVDFQMAIIETVQPYRQGYYKQKYTTKEYLTPEEKKNVEMWGWPWVESYEPYVVIAKATNELPVGKMNLEWEHNSVEIQQLMIAEKRNHQFIHPTITPFSL